MKQKEKAYDCCVHRHGTFATRCDNFLKVPVATVGAQDGVGLLHMFTHIWMINGTSVDLADKLWVLLVTSSNPPLPMCVAMASGLAGPRMAMV